ncbi:uncharacterized protein LOC129581751 isoform X2 [Paramacrobiotus metropolitanus]|uniref:uncharacterized protein LOC129581751 isoform X2 n=1 Tax=Paramacrobiotus metropolitanus TaxID=2943436 RepID=UPI0024457BD9|nr:uncharacterized protein LOC129581751 isoform X2 [Paramacrobiotus metropolitanus]
MDFVTYNVPRILVTVLLLGTTLPRRFRVSAEHNERIEWVSLRSCDMGNTSQVANGTGVMACSNPPFITWYRGYRYLPYQFDLVEDNEDAENEPGGIIAVSRCMRRTFGQSPDRNEPVAIFRGPILVPPDCKIFRVTFWYRLSDPPVFVPGNQQNEFHLKVLIEDNGQPFPSDLIWGRETDYVGLLLRQWNFAEVSFVRSSGAQFTINWLVYHNDDCQINVKSITLDKIAIDNADADSCPTTFATTKPTPAITSTIFTSTTMTSTFSTSTGTATESSSVVTTAKPTTGVICPLPAPCYRWANLKGGNCVLGTEIQPDNTATGIAACPSWFRGYRYFPYQFDLVENDQTSDDKIVDVIALSRCTRRPFGAAPDSEDAVAVLRSPNIGPAACIVWRLTFWYRLSDYPVFDSVNPQNQFHLKVFVENNEETFPTELIWGREEDYDSFRPNVWYSGEGVFHRNESQPYAVYWFAYHNDNCEVDRKEIAVDTIRIQYGQYTSALLEGVFVLNL